MPTLDEIAEMGSHAAEFEAGDRITPVPQEEVHQEQNNRVNEMMQKVLTAETGPGSIGDYLNHPLNFNKSQGLAQILRGLTGLGANLRLAIIDIGLGALRFSKERKGVNNDIHGGGGFPS